MRFMMKCLPVISALAVSLLPEVAAAQAFPISLVQFDGGSGQIVQLKSPKAVAYGSDGKGIFTGSRDFILHYTGNTTGQVYAWDISRRQVRVSAAGRPQIWLACAELQAMPLACSATLRISSEGALVIGGAAGQSNRGASDAPDAPLMGKIPDCPGDPRCPGG